MVEPLAPKSRSDRVPLAILTAMAGLLRVIAAFVVERKARGQGTLCLFDDTVLYWKLAEAIRAGGPYVVDQFGVPHFALRTPGYPLLLAACQALFGGTNTLAPRWVQAALGAACVPMVYALTRRVWPGARRAALLAAAFAAFEPYWAGTSALLLSEAAFVPLMLGTLWGLSVAWAPASEAAVTARAALLAAGAAAGAAVLVKPSWALAPPALLLAWMLADRSRHSRRGASWLILGLMVVMAPWWARNARALGRFVPTALWAGASLYDGLNPRADGSSDMRFLANPEFRTLGEVEQDRALRDAALGFARANPGRAVRLAIVKAGRFWSPWPNAAEFRASGTNLLSAAAVLPLFALLAIGLWAHRRDARALALLAGPLAYFFALHLIFVSSIRYRIPAMVPAFGLAADGWLRVARGRAPGGER